MELKCKNGRKLISDHHGRIKISNLNFSKYTWRVEKLWIANWFEQSKGNVK